jgi:glycerophosphoryl diester phosphodiesterase
MPAFKAAYRMGADMIELDVNLSADQVPVVIHDDTLERTTNGIGAVYEYTVQQLKKYDAGVWMDRFFQGTTIPTLREVLVWSRDRLPVNIELKPCTTPGPSPQEMVEAVVAVVEDLQMEHQILWSSFDTRLLEYLYERSPKAMMGLLYNRPTQQRDQAEDLMEHYHASVFHCSRFEWRYMKKRIAKYPTLIYTVNNTKTMKTLISEGVQGIFTDRPDRLNRLIQSLSQHTR